MKLPRPWFLVALAACGPASSRVEEAPPGDRSGAPLSGDGGFVPAPHRAFPQMPNNGGGFMSGMTLVTIVASNDPDQTALGQFSDDLVTGAWWSAAAGQYGILAPAASLHLVGAAITSDVTTSGLQRYVQQTVGSNGPQPNGNTLYLVYVPPGVNVTDAGFCAFHQGYDYSNLGDSFAMVTRCAAFAGGETPIQAMTRVASHEIMESATDPAGGSLLFGSNPSPPWSAPVWASTQSDWVEVGDVCEGTRIFLGSPDGGAWEYQRTWANASAAAGGDPCAPASPQPYFSVTAPQDWYPAGAGGTVQIPLGGWSAAPRGDWFVRTHLWNGSDYLYTYDAGFWVTESASGAFSADAGCVTRQGMNNGGTATLTVNVPAGASSGDWVVFAVYSFEEDPMTCYPFADRDDYHFWPVGVYVP